MDFIFSGAYCTISATSARNFGEGFLLPRPSRGCLQLKGGFESPGELWISEVVDTFRTDVEKGPINERGWVFQERALSRRTLHFTKNQTYFECGAGIQCETMTIFSNPYSAMMGDPQFPRAIMNRTTMERILLVHDLFETYSGLGLTVLTDRSVAISGLERKVARAWNTTSSYGVFDAFPHRSLLWRRQGEKLLKLITYPDNRPVPSWSWMAYDARDDELNKEIAATCYFEATVFPLRTAELLRQPWRLVLDNPDAVDANSLGCVLVGRHDDMANCAQNYFGIAVVERVQGEYQRVGVVQIQARHLEAEEPGVEGRIR
ncbi:hypothetical protein GQ44DRAFT_250909 [Phaeosphaeriaceae sp. PMI808]|nr:hypothetical protein GQ44DRAFT_250909 [Phaeosphaeriaceae sp. PMI808]